MKAARTDFTVLHAYTADEYGNVQWPEFRDADDLDMLFAKASKRLIVTVEKIVPHNEIIAKPNRTFIPHNWVDNRDATYIPASPINAKNICLFIK